MGNALHDALIELFGVVVFVGGGFVVACLLILAAVAIEYYIKKWRGKK